jgi:hypothetical protein
MFSRILRGVEIAAYTIVFAILLSSGALPASPGFTERVRAYTRPLEFDFFDWTLDAFGVKLAQAALGSPFYFAEEARHNLVAEALELNGRIEQGEYQLEMIYTDPQVRDPEAASVELRVELNRLKARQAQLAPLAEAILQEQISAAVAELGLATAGQPIPPILFHVTPLPYNLIISQRDKIESLASISLLADLPVDQQAALEGRVDAGLNVSSLVVPVGGIGSYPTMIVRTTALDWLADTIAHEWIHNWLTLRPLGMKYLATSELRTMNETAASIAGREIGKLVVQRYYPELAQASRPQSLARLRPAGPIDPDDLRKPFDFRAEMHTTRVQADALLAEGRIEEAEAYMERRRQLFWEHGYAIRKLNQAYFAFHGAYAEYPGGAAGEDPVGPAVRELRARSASLGEFLRAIARMTSFEELLEAVGE